jgi:hypothetical protein
MSEDKKKKKETEWGERDPNLQEASTFENWGTRDERLTQRVQLGRGELLDKPAKKEERRVKDK